MTTRNVYRTKRPAHSEGTFWPRESLRRPSFVVAPRKGGGRNDDEDEPPLNAPRPEHVDAYRTETDGERGDEDRTEWAPQSVTTRRGENAAPRKVASTISIKRFSSIPGELPEPRASTNAAAKPPATPAMTNDSAMNLRGASPEVSAASRLPPDGLQIEPPPGAVQRREEDHRQRGGPPALRSECPRPARLAGRR